MTSELKMLMNLANKTPPIHTHKSSSRMRKESDAQYKNSSTWGSFNSSWNLPPKTKRHLKYDDYFTQNPDTQLSIISAKNMSNLIKNNIWKGENRVQPKEPSAQNTSRHLSSISFGNSQIGKLPTNRKWSEKVRKISKHDSKKALKTDSLFNYNTSNYSSSNIIKMLRVKQEANNDPRLKLSKEQLLTRIITLEQEYKSLKHTFEHRNNYKYLTQNQVKDYKDLIELSWK